jgi:uncharacterized protein (DUF58 family)
MSTVVQTNKSQKYFDPDTLARIRPLGLRARTLVEGLIAGLHRSPLRGQSIEFAQHREYVPGDDVRQVDWKVFARSDKYYLRQYEDETNFTCQLLLDQSESMQYRSAAQGLSKLDYAQLIACSLAYLLIAQQDRAGLVTFSDDIDDWLPPSSSPNQFDDMIRMMEATAGGSRTDVARVVERAVRQITTPSLIIILSDLFDDVDKLMAVLKLARYARHDVMLVHVLDPAELTFPFELMTRFEGLEGYSPIVTDPLLIGGAYRKAMAAFCHNLEQGCTQLSVDYYRMRTDESLAATLPNLLSSRMIRRV